MKIVNVFTNIYVILFIRLLKLGEKSLSTAPY
jgi:hypothetical protein